MQNVDTTSTILSGSSDGLVRAVQIFPTNLLGVVSDHGEWSVERIAVGEGAEVMDVTEGALDNARVNKTMGDEESEELKNLGRWWLGSVGHDETLKITDLQAFFLDEDEDEDEKDEEEKEEREDGAGQNLREVEDEADPEEVEEEDTPEGSIAAADSDEESTDEMPVERKRKAKKDASGSKSKKGRHQVEKQFFDQL